MYLEHILETVDITIQQSIKKTEDSLPLMNSKEIIQQAKDKIKKAKEDALSKVEDKDKVEDAVEDVKDKVQDAIEDVKDKVEEVKGKVEDAIEDGRIKFKKK